MGFVGTQGFAAPELYQMNANFTAAVDTYAFGATALFYGVRNLPRELLNQPPNQVTINPFSVLPFQLPTEVLDALASCFDASSARRPNMTIVRDVIAKHLLYGKHRALVVNGAVASFLDKDRRSVTLNFGAVASIKIDYDGFFFVITSVSGDVFINNGRAVVGQALPGACVLTMGGPELGNRRAYVTFDLSNPGIVL